MSGEVHAVSSTDAVPLLWEAVELLNDRPCCALHLMDDLRVRYDAVLSVLPDLTSRICLACRDDGQSPEVIASLRGLSVTDVERRLDDATVALTDISDIGVGHRRGL